MSSREGEAFEGSAFRFKRNKCGCPILCLLLAKGGSRLLSTCHDEGRPRRPRHLLFLSTGHSPPTTARRRPFDKLRAGAGAPPASLLNFESQVSAQMHGANPGAPAYSSMSFDSDGDCSRLFRGSTDSAGPRGPLSTIHHHYPAIREKHSAAHTSTCAILPLYGFIR